MSTNDPAAIIKAVTDALPDGTPPEIVAQTISAALNAASTDAPVSNAASTASKGRTVNVPEATVTVNDKDVTFFQSYDWGKKGEPRKPFSDGGFRVRVRGDVGNPGALFPSLIRAIRALSDEDAAALLTDGRK